MSCCLCIQTTGLAIPEFYIPIYTAVRFVFNNRRRNRSVTLILRVI